MLSWITPGSKKKIKEIKGFKKLNENECKAYPYLLDTLKAVLRGKFTALSVYTKNLENSHTSDLIIVHLKALEKKEAKDNQEE